MKKNVILFILTLFFACDTADKEKTADEIITEAWEAFSISDYSGAESLFNEAIALDGSKIEAFSGKSWSLLIQSKYTDFSNLLSELQTKNIESIEISAAIAFYQNAINSYSVSNNKVDDVLIVNNEWIFEYKNSINHTLLKKLKAQNYALLDDFSNAILAIRVFDNTFPSNATNQAVIDYIEKLNISLE